MRARVGGVGALVNVTLLCRRSVCSDCVAREVENMSAARGEFRGSVRPPREL